MAAASIADFDYVVIGAGPAGLAAAGHLAKSGAKVAVYEGRPKPQDVFGSYPVVLNARGLSSIEELGKDVYEKTMTVGMPVKELHIVPNNQTVAEVKTWGTGIMRDQTAQILQEHAEAQGNISIFWEHKLTSIDFESHICSFELPDGSLTSIKASRLVAADGNRSKVRRLCEASVEGFQVSADPWGFQIRFMTSKGKEGQTAVSPDFHYVLGDKGYVCQQPNGVWSISLRILPETDKDFLTADEATDERIAELRAYIEKHSKMAHDYLLDEDAYRRFYDCRSFDGVVVKLSCLNPAGWICIIGDAAHAVQPATGEGINSGLEDAAKLGAAVRDYPEDPFMAFDAQHRQNAHALQQIALQARERVVAPPPRLKASNIMVTIGLVIAKKLHIIDGTMQDYMLGAKAHEVGIKSYAELVEMEARQTKVLRPLANGIARIFRIPKEHRKETN